jgi:hypothetical protein
MEKERERIGTLIDAHVWMRRQAKKGGEPASGDAKSILAHLRRTCGREITAPTGAYTNISISLVGVNRLHQFR